MGLPYYYDDRWSAALPQNIAESPDMMFDGIGDYNAYSKYKLGWIDHPFITDSLEEVKSIQLRPSMYYPDMAIVYPNGNRDSSQFLVVEYVIAENGLSIKENNYGGLRIWRVDERQKEQRINQIPLIQSIHNGGTNKFSNSGWETILDTGQNHYSSIFYTGDELTPYSNPSSYIYSGSTWSDAGAAFSGIHISSINTEGNTASCKISIDRTPEDLPLGYSVKKSADSTLFYQVIFDCEVVAHDSKPITVTCDGEALDSVNVLLIDNKDLKVTCNASIVPGNTYTLHIPSGCFISSYGRENDDIYIDITAGGFGSVTLNIKFSGSSTTDTPVYELSDGSLGWFVISDQTLYFCKSSNESYTETPILPGTEVHPYSLNVAQLENNSFVVRIYMNDRPYTYLYSESSGMRLIHEHDTSESFTSWSRMAGDDRIVYVSNWKYRTLSFDGVVSDANPKLDTVSGDMFKIGDSRFAYNHYTEKEILFLDDYLREFLHINTKGTLSAREHVGSILEIDGDFAVFTSDDDAFYITYFDKEGNLLRRWPIIVNDPIKGVIRDVYRTNEGGFIITSYLEYSRDIESGMEWSTPMGKLWLCDESFVPYASFTFLPQGKATDFDGITIRRDNSVVASTLQEYAILKDAPARPNPESQTSFPKLVDVSSDITVDAGKAVSLKTVATGDALKYQWQVLESDGSWKNVQAASTKGDSIIVTAANNVSTYRCIVSDASGYTVASKPIKVIPIFKPTITLSNSSLVYNGKKQQPKINVKVGNTLVVVYK